MLPSVCVVIPVYNGESFIAEAVESALIQQGAELDVVVVDDGSADNSAEIARAFEQVRVLVRSNGGIGAARNTAIATASSDFLAFLDADDVWPPDRIGLMLAEFANDASLEAVFGHAVQFGEERTETPPQAGQLASTMLIRRSSFNNVGPFDETTRVGEFIDWWARAQERGLRWSQIPDVVLRRRIHTSNTGILQAGNRVDYTRVLRAALERRRASQ